MSQEQAKKTSHMRPVVKVEKDTRIYNSYVDEVKRHIRVIKKIRVKNMTRQDLWARTLDAIRDLYNARDVNLVHINSILSIRKFPFFVKRYTEGEIITLQYRHKVENSAQDNIYSLSFELRTSLLNRKVFYVVFTDHAFFYRTLFGLKDSAVKRTYRKNAIYNAKLYFSTLKKRLAEA